MPGVAAIDELERAEAVCRAAGATDVVRAADAQEADWLRQARRAAHYALERLGDVRMEDVGVPRSRVPDMLREIERIAAKHDVRIGTFGHAGDGNLHPDLVFERGDPTGRGQDRRGQDRPLPGRARARRHGHRRARHRLGAAGVARDPARRRRGPGHARDQDRPRPAGHPQPGARRLGIRRPAGRACGRGRVAALAGRTVSRPDRASPNAAGSSKTGVCGVRRCRGRRPHAPRSAGRAPHRSAVADQGSSAEALDLDQPPDVLLGAARAQSGHAGGRPAAASGASGDRPTRARHIAARPRHDPIPHPTHPTAATLSPALVPRARAPSGPPTTPRSAGHLRPRPVRPNDTATGP